MESVPFPLPEVAHPVWNVISIVHFAPAAKAVPQLFVSEKPTQPTGVAWIFDMLNVPVPLLLNTAACGTLFEPL